MQLPTFKKMTWFQLAALLVIAVGFLAYVNTLPNGMFWDDDDFILNNRYIQDLGNWPKYFTENMIAGAGLNSNYWRPALQLVFAVEYRLWGAWTPGFHAVNMAGHILAAILLLGLLQRLFKNKFLSLATALIFLLHPVQVEAVSYVNSFGDSLSVIFILGGLHAYMRWRESGRPAHDSGWFFSALGAYLIALMSKETAIVMPGLVFLIDWIVIKESLWRPKLAKIFGGLWAFLAMLGGYVLLRATVLNFNNTFNIYHEQNVFTGSFYVRLLTFFKVLWLYAAVIFWPVDLHMERSPAIGFVTSPFNWQVGAGVIIFGLLLAALVYFWKKSPAISFGLGWFFIGLSITSNLAVPVSGLMYEHWLYLPLAGFALAILTAGTLIFKSSRLQKIGLVILLIFLIGFLMQTVRRNFDWRDPVIFYQQTLRYAPQSYRLLNNLGMEYADLGEYSQAIIYYRRAAENDPGNPVAFHNLANSYGAQGNFAEAEKNYRQALELDPKFLFSYNSLAALYFQHKKYPEAFAVLEKLLDRSTSPGPLLYQMIQIAVGLKDLDRAGRYASLGQTLNLPDYNWSGLLVEIQKLQKQKL